MITFDGIGIASLWRHDGCCLRRGDAPPASDGALGGLIGDGMPSGTLSLSGAYEYSADASDPDIPLYAYVPVITTRTTNPEELEPGSGTLVQDWATTDPPLGFVAARILVDARWQMSGASSHSLDREPGTPETLLQIEWATKGATDHTYGGAIAAGHTTAPYLHDAFGSEVGPGFPDGSGSFAFDQTLTIDTGVMWAEVSEAAGSRINQRIVNFTQGGNFPIYFGAAPDYTVAISFRFDLTWQTLSSGAELGGLVPPDNPICSAPPPRMATHTPPHSSDWSR